MKAFLYICSLNFFFLYASTETVANSSVPISVFQLSDHKDIIANYQPQIDALEARIDAEANIAQLHIKEVTTTLKTSVNNAGVDAKEEIGILTDTIGHRLSQSSASNADVKLCLQKQDLLAKALTTSEITNCLSSDLDALDDLRLDIKRLKSPTTAITASCQKLNPLESQDSAIKKCIVTNIQSITNNLNSNISKLSSTINSAQKDTNCCITKTQYNLNKKIKDITRAVAFC